MRSPLGSEEAAFRFVLATIAYFAPIVTAAWVATWLGAIVFVVMTVFAVVVVRRGTAAPPPPVSTERADVGDTRRILVLTDATPVGPRLRAALERLTADVSEDVLLICAVVASPGLRDGGDARLSAVAAAQETALQELRADGVNARGSVAVGDPLDALEEALRSFDADEIVIATGRRDVSTPKADAEDVASALRVPFTGPITLICDDR